MAQTVGNVSSLFIVKEIRRMKERWVPGVRYDDR